MNINYVWAPLNFLTIWLVGCWLTLATQRWNRNQVYSNITQRLQWYAGASIKLWTRLKYNCDAYQYFCIHSVRRAKLILIGTPLSNWHSPLFQHNILLSIPELGTLVYNWAQVTVPTVSAKDGSIAHTENLFGSLCIFPLYLIVFDIEFLFVFHRICN